MDTTPVAWDGGERGDGLNFNFKYINVNPFNSLKKLTKVQKILNPGFFTVKLRLFYTSFETWPFNRLS